MEGEGARQVNKRVAFWFAHLSYWLLALWVVLVCRLVLNHDSQADFYSYSAPEYNLWNAINSLTICLLNCPLCLAILISISISCSFIGRPGGLADYWCDNFACQLLHFLIHQLRQRFLISGGETNKERERKGIILIDPTACSSQGGGVCSGLVGWPHFTESTGWTVSNDRSPRASPKGKFADMALTQRGMRLHSSVQ